jgi:hypothetical protein
MPATATELNEAEFIAQFAPEPWQNGQYYRQRSWRDDRSMLRAAAAEHRVWSVRYDPETDDWIVLNGSYPGSAYYVMCAEPYVEGDHWVVR